MFNKNGKNNTENSLALFRKERQYMDGSTVTWYELHDEDSLTHILL